MTIDDLYAELGRCVDDTHALNAAIMEENRRSNERRQAMQAKVQEKTNRQEELREAIRLVKEGTDPVLAKLKAKESLEDRRVNADINQVRKLAGLQRTSTVYAEGSSG